MWWFESANSLYWVVGMKLRVSMRRAYLDDGCQVARRVGVDRAFLAEH